MLANFLIGLREGLEASLVVGILIAYLVKTDRKGLISRVWSGVAIALAISIGAGTLLTFGATSLPEGGEELLGGALSIAAVGLVTWMILWMVKASRSMSAELRASVDKAAAVGGVSVAMVALLAVGREGLETALFLWAATQTAAAGGSAAGPLVGALLGILVAVGIGYASYKGALRLNLASFFRWTGAFLVLIAGGVLAYGVHELQEVGVLPGEGVLAFDLTATLDPGSLPAVLLRGVLNLRPVMSWLEVGAWAVYVVPVLLLVLRRTRAAHPAPVVTAARAGTSA